MTTHHQTEPTYVLGYSEIESQRLINQSRFYGELTEEVLRRAGIGSGVRVLDVGCGVGDVTFLLASIVGPSGSVLGVDRAPESVQLARERATTLGLSNVAFQEGDIANLALDEKFDALVGRFVLLYMSDPTAVLQGLRRLVPSGGLVVFQEMDMSAARSVPRATLYETCLEWIRETFRLGGVEIDMGSRLFPTFQRAGLPAPEMMLQARIEGKPESFSYTYIALAVRSLLPMMERYGVTTATEVQIDTLAERLRAEVVQGGGVVIQPSLVGAWVRVL